MCSPAFSPKILKSRNLDEFLQIVSVAPENALLVREIMTLRPLGYARFDAAFHSEANQVIGAFPAMCSEKNSRLFQTKGGEILKISSIH
jgi:hypothetical protein